MRLRYLKVNCLNGNISIVLAYTVMGGRKCIPIDSDLLIMDICQVACKSIGKLNTVYLSR